MEKPQPKKEVAVSFYSELTRQIRFNATKDAVEDFKVFGLVYMIYNEYGLIVDSRYDFNEVIAYIQNYG